MARDAETVNRGLVVLPFEDPIGGYDSVSRFDSALEFRSQSVLEFRSSDQLHRLDGPARVSVSKWSGERVITTVEWYREGVLHRQNGPALLTRRGRAVDLRDRIETGRGGDNAHAVAIWYNNGLLHRVDGPAVVWPDGWEEWFWEEDRHRIELPAVVGPDGHREYHHRDYVAKDPARQKPDRSWWRLQDSCDGYYRERGPAILLSNGYRYWARGSSNRLATVGPREERPDGSVRFQHAGFRSPDHPEVVQLRRDLTQFVEARFRQVLGATLSWTYPGERFDINRWDSLAIEERRMISSTALDAWERTRGLLHPRVEMAYSAWIERFEMETESARTELRLMRDEMRGYLPVALRRMASVEVNNAETWQSRFEMLGLPVVDSAAEVSVESRLIRVVTTVPSMSVAVPEYAGTGLMEHPTTTPKLRTHAVRKKLYLAGLSEVALAILNSVGNLSEEEGFETIALNLMVDDIDPATGLDRRYCVLSMQVEVSALRQVNLQRVDPVLCVKGFGSVVPRGDGETLAVKPILQFDKEDVRIIAPSEIASQLDSRPNLMLLSPTEFETLIQNLFESIGLDTHQTRASRDGGVDAIGYDSRPIFGGKVVIQAKRYKNVVGVSAVRDLYGTVMNEGASKGILVTTSGYGAASYEFAKNKPLELLEGSHLLHLLKEHLSINAVIVPPDDWIDREPSADSPQ